MAREITMVLFYSAQMLRISFRSDRNPIFYDFRFSVDIPDDLQTTKVVGLRLFCSNDVLRLFKIWRKQEALFTSLTLVGLRKGEAHNMIFSLDFVHQSFADFFEQGL